MVQLFLGNPSQSYKASPPYRIALSVTCHPTQTNAPRLNPSQRRRHSERWKVELDLVVGYVPRWFTCLPIQVATTCMIARSDPVWNQQPRDRKCNVLAVILPSYCVVV